MMLTKMYRAASMRQDVDVPRHGAQGQAWRVPGAVDSDAFLFQPDGDTNAYYCKESDLAFADDEADCACGAVAVYHPVIGLQVVGMCADCYAVEFPEKAASFELARRAPNAGEFHDPALGTPE